MFLQVSLYACNPSGLWTPALRRLEVSSLFDSLCLPIDLSTDREIKKGGKVLSLGGTEFKFVTGPRIAHEHGENRAQKDDLMPEL